MVRPLLVAAACAALVLAAAAQSSAGPGAALVLNADDIRIEQRTDGGYHLFVRARPGIGSVLLTESTSDPSFHTQTYSYRALEWNPINGDEKRIIDGAFLPGTSKIWSLVDSTPEPDPRFGTAFHVFIPWVVAWGYPWTRNGRVFIGDGSFIDIRVFAKPYADYSGPFADNPFMLRLRQRPAAQPTAAAPPAPSAAPPAPLAQAPTTSSSPPQAPPAPVPPSPPSPAPKPPARAQAAAARPPQTPPAVAAAPPPQTPPAAPQAAAARPSEAALPGEPAHRAAPKPSIPAKIPALGRYMKETVDAFYDISTSGRGKTLLAGDARELAAALGGFFSPGPGISTDIVICLDTTESMQASLDALRADAPALLKALFAGSGSRRIGLILYRDYFEEYLTRRVDFVETATEFLAQLDEVRVAGGRDLPEAVYEGLYAALTEFPWSADKKVIVLVGDAPPHPLPRGAIDRDSVVEAASKEGVELDAVVLPHPGQDQ